jgi:phenylalanyl-tRNA synthetase beta chain
MKAPLKWLRDYVDVDLPAGDLARRLTLAGFEVSDIKIIGGTWDKIVIGQITAINPHPNADRLRLATVDIGREPVTVVCGAPNLIIGDKIAFAGLGAQMLDPHTGKMEVLKTAKIRGVSSSGMISSEKELGISENHEGILVLPMDAPVGTPLADYLGDTIFDVDITPNRPDCLSVIGLAREIAAITGKSIHVPEINYEETGKPISQQISIEIADADLCGRYSASLITGVKIADSPRWLQERLLACGMRPINNIVDITNYVMLEYGQPLHSFDYDRLRGKKIIVRRARDGESIISLDDVQRNLVRDTLVIADEQRAVAVAGVMGGANSEVTSGTTSILLESANFNPASIHYTSRNLTMTSEASMRFERGISPGVTFPALRHATQLIMQLGEGQVAEGIIDVFPAKREPAPISLSKNEVTRILGIEYTIDQISSTLVSLGFECRVDGDGLKAVAPYWRSDIRLSVDLIEEVGRIIGYDRIPMTLLSQQIPHQTPDPLVRLKREIRQALAGVGFQEVVTYSLTSYLMLQKLSPEADVHDVSPVKLVNPMTAELECLRPNLRVNLLAALSANRRHEDGGIRIFELGKVYLPREKDLPDEPEILCGLLNGTRVEKSWLGGEGSFDFYDAKGAVEALLSKLHIPVKFEKSCDTGLHPARQAAVVTGNNIVLGIIGEIHPKVADAFEISGPVCLFELSVSELLPFTSIDRLFHPIPRFPGSIRDLALVVDTAVTNRQVEDIIRTFPLVDEISLFDVYSGKQVAAGKKSLAYRLVYQSPEHTLTDDEVNKVQEQILGRLAKELGAVLRG